MHSPAFGSRFFSVSFARLRACSRKKQAKIRKSFHLRKFSYSFHAYTRAQSDFCQLIVANILTYMRFSVSPPSSFSHAVFHVASAMHRPNLGDPSSSGLSPALRVSAAVFCFRRYSARPSLCLRHFVQVTLFIAPEFDSGTALSRLCVPCPELLTPEQCPVLAIS